jgi:hypothetical protein
MVIPENRLFCRLDGLTTLQRSQQRRTRLTELGLLEADSIVVFEDAVQAAAQFLNFPVCWLSVITPEQEQIKSAIGLSHLGLMNPLIRERSLGMADSFGVYVTDSQQVLAIEDTHEHPAFANSLLAQQYGIRTYLGVPLISSQGVCIGVLAAMSTQLQPLTSQDLEFFALTARLAMSEYEHHHLLKQQVPMVAPSTPAVPPPAPALPPPSEQPRVNPLKFELLAQLTQELRTPLTSVMGMASVLTREVYGPLTQKQKEYLDIIHHSGEYLLSLVQEVLELSSLDLAHQTLNPTTVDIEMLCQQAIATLEQAASRRDQQIQLTVEPGHRIWLLDKDKMRQMLYHLTFSVIQTSTPGSIVRLHVSHKSQGLKLALWTSHPHLGDGIPYPETYLTVSHLMDPTSTDEFARERGSVAVMAPPTPSAPPVPPPEGYQKNLGLLLSRQVVELHGGKVMIQGTGSSSYRYVITIPRLAPTGIRGERALVSAN